MLDEHKDREDQLSKSLKRTDTERQSLSDKYAGLQRALQTIEGERNELCKQAERLEKERSVLKRALQRVESLRDTAEKENSRSALERYSHCARRILWRGISPRTSR